MDAVQLLSEYTRRVSEGDLDSAFDLFADDAVFEFLYFPSVGIGERVAGIKIIRRNIGDFFMNQTESFRFHDVRIFAADVPERAAIDHNLGRSVPRVP